MLVSIDDGVPHVAAALRTGAAVVLPLPSPLPYGVVATNPAAVNRAKGRPEGQPLGVAVGDFGPVAPFLRVSPDAVGLIEWMCVTRQLNVFAPVTDDAPQWMVQDPAQTGGFVGLMGSWLPELKEALDSFGPLFISSANPSGTPPATTARAAEALFGDALLVVDGDGLRAGDRRHGSATIIRVHTDGGLTVARHGVNNQSYQGKDEEFLELLLRGYSQRS